MESGYACLGLLLSFLSKTLSVGWNVFPTVWSVKICLL
jgi:hypothetical protein